MSAWVSYRRSIIHRSFTKRNVTREKNRHHLMIKIFTWSEKKYLAVGTWL
jgi:hypothetical protein